jgi:phage/plasmid-associated DNA primase
LYADYTVWAKAANEYVLSQKRFAEALGNLGFDRWQHPQTRRHGFSGLALKTRNDDLGM